MSDEALTELRNLAARMLELTTAQPVETPRLLTFEQTAEALAVSRTTVQEIVDRGELPVVTVTGRAPRVDTRDVEAFIKQRRERRRVEWRP